MVKDPMEETGEYAYSKSKDAPEGAEEPTGEVIARISIARSRYEYDQAADAILAAVQLIDEVLKIRGEVPAGLRTRLAAWRATAMDVTK